VISAFFPLIRRALFEFLVLHKQGEKGLITGGFFWSLPPKRQKTKKV
jgi:hypothetical protein